MATPTSSHDSLAAQFRRIPSRAFGKQFVKEFQEDDLLGLAAEVAYHLIFAIPPLLVLTVTVAGVINRFTSVPVEETLRRVVNERAPASVQEVMDAVITNAVGKASGELLSIGLLTTAAVALWSGSNGLAAIMKAYNRAYNVAEGRPFVRKRLVAIALTIMLIVFVNTAFALFVFGEGIGVWLADWLGLGNQFQLLWEVSRWPAAVVLFLVLLAVLYHLAPAVEQTFHWISPGSFVATILWIATLFGFRTYLSVASPGSTYGAFSSAIVFLFFLYLTSVVLLVGAEVNAILQRRFDEAVVYDRADHPERLTSADARKEAAEEARDLEERQGQRSSSHRHRNRRDPRTPASRRARTRTRPSTGFVAGVVLAVLGSTAGWVLGWRAARRFH